MEISIKKGEGVSQAIKRQLKEEGIQENQFTGSIWSKIHSALKDDTSTITHNGNEQKIGDLWVELGSNVKTYVDDELNILETTWAKIKGFFTKSNNGTPTSDTKTKGSGSTNRTASGEKVDKQSLRLKYGNNEKVNKRLNDAAELLTQLANSNHKQDVTMENDNEAYVRLDGGKEINIIKGESGELFILVNGDKYEEGDDESDVAFTFDEQGNCTLGYNTDYSNREWEKYNIKINNPQFNTNLLNAVSKIFGDKGKEILKDQMKILPQAQEKQNKEALKTRVKVKNENHKKANQELEAAEALLAKASVMTEKNKIYKGHNNDENYDYYGIDVNADGKQWIEVKKYPDGSVRVSVSTKKDSRNSNCAEVDYIFDKNGKCKIKVDTDNNTNATFEVSLDNPKAGYAYKMKSVVKAIFGDEINW